MKYIALKPCKFSRQYLIGESIPEGEVLPYRAAALISQGTITVDTKSRFDKSSAAQGHSKASEGSE